MHNRILIVCSANQCRSPMAEAILCDMVAANPVLSSQGIDIRSAGAFYPGGSPATDNAIVAILTGPDSCS